MPRHEVTAEQRGSDIFLNSNTQAWSMHLPVGDAAYAAALCRSIGNVNNEFRDREVAAARDGEKVTKAKPPKSSPPAPKPGEANVEGGGVPPATPPLGGGVSRG